MKNTIFAIILVTFLVSCGEKSIESIKVDSGSEKTESSKSVDVSLSTPELFGGSGFGIAFMSFIKTQNFDLAIQFTSKESINKHGVDAILDMYKSLKVDYKLNQTSKLVNGDTTTIRYTTNEYATNKYKDFMVVVENDSCKIVLPENLKDFLK